MPWNKPLTTGDLHKLAEDAFDSDDPQVLAADLVEAVERGEVADKADIGLALMLAAEISDDAGDPMAALPLAERAVEAYELYGTPPYGYPRAYRAQLLMKLGREEAAMAELSALRGLLTEDVSAASYLRDVLSAAGRAELAEQWLSEALNEALRRRSELESNRSDPAYGEAATVAYQLAQQRYGIRRDLGLPYDANDALADRLLESVAGQLSADEDDYEGTAVLFWPKTQFDALLARWPALAEQYGQSWDEHRARLQQGLTLLTDSSVTQLALLSGSADGLAEYASSCDGDPVDPEVRQGYVEHLEHGDPHEARWPPGRNEACWCGSTNKYKKCCLPRSS
ncbi:SEC-C domain-containing protein [Kribbella sp. NBC_01510]|uniref:SEC-C metal-binding domain-containing protein n=1 Tax=Kribbella sp. NBC_01510 TaxID=2903581 RepID=UPI00386986D8